MEQLEIKKPRNKTKRGGKKRNHCAKYSTGIKAFGFHMKTLVSEFEREADDTKGTLKTHETPSN